MGLRLCISNKLPGAADAVGSRSTGSKTLIFLPAPARPLPHLPRLRTTTRGVPGPVESCQIHTSPCWHCGFLGGGSRSGTVGTVETGHFHVIERLQFEVFPCPLQAFIFRSSN